MKRGGPQFPAYVSTENIGEDQKKVFTSFDVQITLQNQVKTKKKKGQRVLTCPVFTVSLTTDIYQLIFYLLAAIPAPPHPPRYEASNFLDTPWVEVNFVLCDTVQHDEAMQTFRITTENLPYR